MVLGVTIKRTSCIPPHTNDSVDPLSAQADELRHLLNVVSGRARDADGRLSEPIVKEELAIVEFLTQKAPTDGQPENESDSKSRSRNPSGRPDSSSGAEDGPAPVDLLLNLARTASGRRAAEEEQRQLQVQQRREMEEQRREGRRRSNSNRSNTDSSSPWDFVAPAMPGLDVHQPFGQGQRVPRPLQPPPPRRPGSMGPPAVPSDQQQPFQNPFQQIHTNEQPFQVQQQQPTSFNPPVEQAFGTPIVDPYAFSSLSASMQSNVENSPFNPFALPQTGPTETDGESVDRILSHTSTNLSVAVPMSSPTTKQRF